MTPEQEQELDRLEAERQSTRDDLAKVVSQHWDAMPAPVREAWEKQDKAMWKQFSFIQSIFHKPR